MHLKIIYNEVTSQYIVIYTCHKENEAFGLNMFCHKEDLVFVFDTHVLRLLACATLDGFQFVVHGERGIIRKCQRGTSVKDIRDQLSLFASTRLTRASLALFKS